MGIGSYSQFMLPFYVGVSSTLSNYDKSLEDDFSNYNFSQQLYSCNYSVSEWHNKSIDRIEISCNSSPTITSLSNYTLASILSSEWHNKSIDWIEISYNSSNM